MRREYVSMCQCMAGGHLAPAARGPPTRAVKPWSASWPGRRAGQRPCCTVHPGGAATMAATPSAQRATQAPAERLASLLLALPKLLHGAANPRPCRTAHQGERATKPSRQSGVEATHVHT